MNILTGALHRMVDRDKWLRVLDSYTGAINRGEAIDIATAPWEEPPKYPGAWRIPKSACI
jgi:hypothetical protein